MKKVLFIDRDGTLVVEPPVTFQLDNLEQLEFIQGVFQYLSRIAKELDYELVMVTNQDGLGTKSFQEETSWPAPNKTPREAIWVQIPCSPAIPAARIMATKSARASAPISKSLASTLATGSPTKRFWIFSFFPERKPAMIPTEAVPRASWAEESV